MPCLLAWSPPLCETVTVLHLFGPIWPYLEEKNKFPFELGGWSLELETIDTLASERLRLIRFNNRFIIDYFQHIKHILKLHFPTNADTLGVCTLTKFMGKCNRMYCCLENFIQLAKILYACWLRQISPLKKMCRREVRTNVKNGTHKSVPKYMKCRFDFCNSRQCPLAMQ